MSDSKLAKLFFTVELIDRISKPAGKAGASVQKMYNHMRIGMDGLSKGALSVGAGFAALSQFTGPARDLSKAVGEVASLGTSRDELDKLKIAALDFSSQFGVSASAVVRSAYDIQSAIPGLTEGALAAFSTSAGLLAKATKSDVSLITSYYGTMYNVFSETAEKMGQDKWVKRLAGRTAEAVRIFKTTGPAMAAAFGRIGSAAQVKGVGESEQMATLGMLQATMSGEEAGTKYKAFLTSIGRAGGALGGISNKDGSLMSLSAILDKIDAKSSKFNKVQKGNYLKNLLGSDEAVAFVQNLSGKTGEFRKNIEQIEKVQGDSNAAKMAKNMIDPYEQMTTALENMKITIGGTILPALDKLMIFISDVANAVRWMIDTIPGFSIVVGALTLAISSASVAFGLWWTFGGLIHIFSAISIKLRVVNIWMWKNVKATHAGTLAHKIATGMMWVWNNVLSWTAIKTNISTSAQWLWNGAVSAGKGFSAALAGSTIMLGTQFLWMKGCALVSSAATWILNGGFIALGASLWGVVAALWATGIPEIILLIAGLGAAVFAMVYYWNEWTGAVVNFASMIWGKLISGFKWLMSLLDTVKLKLGAFSALLYAIPILGPILLIRDLINTVAELWNTSDSFWNFFCGIFSKGWDFIAAPFIYIGELLSGLWEKISSFFTGIPSLLSGMLGSIGGGISKLWSWIPGLGRTAAPDVKNLSAAEPTLQRAVDVRRNPAPGIGPRNTNTNHNTNFGGVTINARTFPTPGQLEEWSLLNG